ncbi:MAG: hypothetical protein PF482_06050 [Desulfobacteraceae bacterium]|nr:hypothetical protein [Desulfobacteraceae bacterium]
MNRPFLKVGYVGLLVIIMSVTLVIIFPSKAPKMPDGFFTPIIAFEFIKTKAEVFQLFVATDGTTRQAMVNAMDLGNRLDYIYMCLYSVFFLLFCQKCADISKKKLYYTGMAIAVVVLLGDALENRQLLGITAKLENGDFAAELSLLYFFTWIKWGGIAAVFLLLVPWFAKGGLFSKTIGMAGSITIALGVLAFLNRSMITEIFSLAVGLMFLFMIIYCFTFKSDEIL